MLPSYNLHHLYADLGSSSSLARILIREATSTSISLLSDLCLDFNHPQEPYWRTVRNILRVLESFAHDDRCSYPSDFLRSDWRQRLTATRTVQAEPFTVTYALDGFYRPDIIEIRTGISCHMRLPKIVTASRRHFYQIPSLRLRIARRIDRTLRNKLTTIIG